MKDAYYFPHDSNATDDPKIMMLIAQLQMEGYGIYWVIIEHLRNQPDFKSKLGVLPALAMRNGSTAEKFQTVATRFDLFIIEDDEFYSQSLIDRMQRYLSASNKARKAALTRWKGKKGAQAMLEHSVSNASKVKNSKVKETNTGDRDHSATPQRGDEKKPSDNPMSVAAQRERFNFFWEHYHEVTGLPKTDKDAAFKKWKRKEMTLNDQRAAYKGIKTYYFWAMKEYGDKQFIKKARTYLDDRAWENDYRQADNRKSTTTFVR